MTTPFLGELEIVAFNFAPKGFALANGQILPISQNAALFALLGTTYGGNGVQNFALPNLQGRTPVHFGNGIVQGQVSGEENHTLTVSELPQHGHGLAAQNAPAVAGVGPGNNSFGTASTNPYRSLPTFVPMAAPTANGGGNQPHPNLQPYLTVSIVIALQGVFPSRN